MRLETERLIIRNWQDAPGDRAFFHEINSDPEVMAFFPHRRTVDELDALFDEVKRRIDETGLCFYALALKETGELVGFCGLNRPDLQPILGADAVEIGWRMARRYWGHGYVTEAANALLRHAFETLKLPEIVSFAVLENTRSTAVMQRIGMHYLRDFDHPRVPDEASHLKRHALYVITAQQWRASRAS